MSKHIDEIRWRSIFGNEWWKMCKINVDGKYSLFVSLDGIIFREEANVKNRIKQKCEIIINGFLESQFKIPDQLKDIIFQYTMTELIITDNRWRLISGEPRLTTPRLTKDL